jgi:hypothetical protein
MSRTSLELIDAETYEAKQADDWGEVLRLYAQGWRCVAPFVVRETVFYVLERPVPR